MIGSGLQTNRRQQQKFENTLINAQAKHLAVYRGIET